MVSQLPKPYRGSTRRKVSSFTDPAPILPEPCRYASKAALAKVALPSTERRALEKRRYGVGGGLRALARGEAFSLVFLVELLCGKVRGARD
jgi:hypothetical protein